MEKAGRRVKKREVERVFTTSMELRFFGVSTAADFEWRHEDTNWSCRKTASFEKKLVDKRTSPLCVSRIFLKMLLPGRAKKRAFVKLVSQSGHQQDRFL